MCILSFLAYYVLIYPLAMSIIWTIGGLFYWKSYEANGKSRLKLHRFYPHITIVVPCHNEESTIIHTCRNLSTLDYQNYHVIFVDDASLDNTHSIIRDFAEKHPFLHLISIKDNLGKAGAVNIALQYVNTPLVFIMDADTLISGKTLKWLAEPFINREDIGAVTANPIPCNKNGILSKLQTVEFSSIIGLIKRTQSFFGYIFTISGCAALYRTDVLRKVGGFSSDTATEDIDITWRIQKAGYKVRYQPQAPAYIQVPDIFKDFIKQRKRWVSGGWHFLRTHKDIFCHLSLWKLWIIYIDFILSYFWAFCFVAVLSASAFILMLGADAGINIIPATHCAAAVFTFFVQTICAIKINTAYDKNIKRCLLYTPWYPLFFFSIGAFLIVWTTPQLFTDLKNCGKWSSPKRVGIKK